MDEPSLVLRSLEDVQKQKELPDFAAFEKKILSAWRRNQGTAYATLQEDLEHLCNRAEAPSLVILEICNRAILLPNLQKLTSLFALIVKFYDRWVEANPANKVNHERFLDRRIQDQAVQLMFKAGGVLMPYFDKLFNCLWILRVLTGNDHQRRISGGWIMIVHYKLQSRFEMREILPPLFFLRHGTTIDDYLDGHPEMQKAFVRWLDSLIGMKLYELKRNIESYPMIPDSAVDAISGKPLEKQVWRYLNRYNLSQELIPRSRKIRCEMGLRYIHVMLCSLNQIDVEQYIDHVQHAMRSSKELQLFFIQYLIRSRDYIEASRWARFCNFHERLSASSQLRPYLQMDTQDAERFAEYMQDREIQIFETSPAEPYEYEGNIVDFVGGMAKLQALTELLKSTRNSVIAIDTEFRPMYITCVERVALLQLAVNGRVFLVDTLTVQDEAEASRTAWKNFFDALFTDETNLKLGFAFGGDVRVISASSPLLTDLDQRMKRVGCLIPLVHALLRKDPNLITGLGSNDEGKAQFKLLDLTAAVTGRQMEKKEQLSNWDRRPLRRAQMDYAAMDVITVIEVYNKLKKMAESRKINFGECEDACILQFQPAQKKTPSRPKGRKIKADRDEIGNLVEKLAKSGANGSRGVDDVRFICDAMLFGVGKDLRKCGIDAEMCNSHADIAAKMKEDPGRVIITSGKAFLKLQNLFPRNTLNMETPANMMTNLESVLRTCKINVRKEDIFSRCQKCNFKSFVCVPFPIMDWMMKLMDKSLTAEERNAILVELASVPAQERYGDYAVDLQLRSEESIQFQTDKGAFVDVLKMTVKVPELQKPEEVKVKLGALIPAVVTEDKKFFRICGNCGKIFWDGGHIANHLEKLNDKGIFEEESPEPSAASP
ncbi:hypothetical protein L596_020246 [Steinernema carpocapsae]|uniref:3'-5' exonuclease domain-containing protein n=1 Tax=Steinernema carpocapsae TaxID=34508 RepID=A0A4V6A0V4_STECR|nr:hypothetical protein L596_020246 [Steinernema carpocapsae]